MLGAPKFDAQPARGVSRSVRCKDLKITHHVGIRFWHQRGDLLLTVCLPPTCGSVIGMRGTSGSRARLLCPPPVGWSTRGGGRPGSGRPVVLSPSRRYGCAHPTLGPQTRCCHLARRDRPHHRAVLPAVRITRLTAFIPLLADLTPCSCCHAFRWQTLQRSPFPVPFSLLPPSSLPPPSPQLPSTAADSGRRCAFPLPRPFPALLRCPRGAP